MHRDPKPGLFDFAGHSVRYAIIAGLITGFIASLLGFGGLSIWQKDRGEATAQKSTVELESSMAAQRKATPKPEPTAALRY